MNKLLYYTAVSLLVVFILIGAPRGAEATTALLTETTVSANHVTIIKSRPFILTSGTTKWTVSASDTATWYKLKSSGGQTKLQLRPDAIYDYLNRHISPKVNDLGEQSRFETVAGNLHLVASGRKGKIVDGIKTSLAIRAALAAGKTSAPVSLKEYRPAIFSAADFKKLTFPDKLATGESNFAGSPKNRIHNIQVAARRYHGLVIMPGEEFSFNQYLGAVDAQNGYLPELVIKDNATTPEYGGGICQVSTTAFRGALQAGLLVTSRRNHSYPVAYYGTPGYDATVYTPNPDFRFKNDLKKPVHIRTAIAGSRLTFEVWGTNEGRVVKINGPFVTARRPDGSLTAAVAQIVTKGGQTIREQNFVSNYQSPDKFPTIRAANGE